MAYLKPFFLIVAIALAPTVAISQTFGSVNFDFNSHQLDAEAQAQVSEIAERLKATQSYKQTVVVGYTDAVGASGYNQTLGQKRASAVANALIALGVPARNIGTVASRGENDLLVMVSTAKRANRRVTVSLEDIFAACPSYRRINLARSAIGSELQSDLSQRLQTAVNYYASLARTGQNGSAFQMAGAAREDCNVAVGLDGNSIRKVEYSKRCLCNSARLEVALGLLPK